MSEITETPDSVVELRRLADETAADAQTYLDALAEVASALQPDLALPLLLLALSQTLFAGARLGAIQDVVPSERFEPDTPGDGDVEPVRAGLANLLEGIDEYVDVCDPLTDPTLVPGVLSDDLAAVAAELGHGLEHYRAGRVDEALWWWQFSYLTGWGLRATSALRVLQAVIGHLRQDADEESVAEAEFDALHATDRPGA
jgi:Domain of unknown function (DUF5063)